MYIQDAIIVLVMAVVNLAIMIVGAYTLWTWTSPLVFGALAAAYAAGTVYTNTIIEPTDFDE